MINSDFIHYQLIRHFHYFNLLHHLNFIVSLNLRSFNASNESQN